MNKNYKQAFGIEHKTYSLGDVFERQNVYDSCRVVESLRVGDIKIPVNSTSYPNDNHCTFTNNGKLVDMTGVNKLTVCIDTDETFKITRIWSYNSEYISQDYSSITLFYLTEC
jgi:hypothetical protein